MSPPDSPFPPSQAISLEHQVMAQLKAIREASEASARRASRIEHSLAELADAVSRGSVTSTVPPSAMQGTRALPGTGPHRERFHTQPGLGEDAWGDQSSRIELPPQQLPPQQVVTDVLNARELEQRRETEKQRREFRAKIVQGVITAVASGVIVAEIVSRLSHH